MEYIEKNNDIYIISKDFCLSETLDCGQAFRWKQLCDEDGFEGFSGSNYLKILNDKEYIVLKNTTREQFENYWIEYFDLNTDYSQLKSQYSSDETLKNACEYAPGIRLLKQDKWEALCCFIISQNNNIPRIKGIVERLCENYGQKTDNGYTFPSAKTIASKSVEDLAPLRAGFRARYIPDAATKVSSGEVDLEKISTMPYDEAKAELMKIVGVGVKVADCTLLYGMYRTESFPVDVWIKRVLEKYYPNGLPKCIKGSEGIAQQYLFHYIRNLEK